VPRRHADGAPPSGGAFDRSERRDGQGRRSEDREDYEEIEPNDVDESSLVADTYYGYARRSGAD
jgi:hypothetical protein